MKATAILALAAVVLTGCVTAPEQVYLQTAYTEADHTAYLLDGTSTVKGQAFMRQQGGGVVTCAGSNVVLVPATAYFREMLSTAASGRQVMNTTPPGVGRVSICDAQGNFVFKNIPAAGWFVTTMVQWRVGDGQQGGGLLKEFTVADGATVDVLLTDANFVAR